MVWPGVGRWSPTLCHRMTTRRGYAPLLLIIAMQVPAMASVRGDSLRAEIERMIAPARGLVGVAVHVPETGDTLTINGDARFPMQSVYKFPLALAVLRQVDQGTLSLSQELQLSKEDLLPNTWSPLRERYPDGNVVVTLDELLTYTVSLSDNNGCDILFRLVGGPAAVNEYVHGLGITDMAIVATEEEMHRGWEVQFQNWSSPAAMCRLLDAFYSGNILSQRSREYLWSLMVQAATGSGRLKGRLPEGTVVAHKSGSSGTNDEGITAATNDVGIIALPWGGHVILVVFVADSAADKQTRDEVIADIARVVWDAYSHQ